MTKPTYYFATNYAYDEMANFSFDKIKTVINFIKNNNMNYVLCGTRNKKSMPFIVPELDVGGIDFIILKDITGVALLKLKFNDIIMYPLEYKPSWTSDDYEVYILVQRIFRKNKKWHRLNSKTWMQIDDYLHGAFNYQ